MRCAISIPAYNASNYIGDALKSLLAQDFAGFDIYVFDNTEDDSTKWAVEKYSCARLFYHKNERNLGYVGNVNKCLGVHTKGYDYVGILHHDDMHLGESVAAFVRIALMHLEAGLVTSSIVYADSSGLTSKYELKTESVYMKGSSAIGQCWSIFCSSTFYSSQALRKVGLLSEDYPYSADVEHFARIGKEFDIVSTAQILAVSRLHGENYRYKTWAREDFARNFFSMLCKIEQHDGASQRDAKKMAARKHSGTYGAIGMHLFLKANFRSGFECCKIICKAGIYPRVVPRVLRGAMSEIKMLVSSKGAL